MSVAYDDDAPVILFGSEAEAIAVPVYKDGKWLRKRIDLMTGEIMRIGAPLRMNCGSFNKISKKPHDNRFLLSSGVEIRSYLLNTASEIPRESFLTRSKNISHSPSSYDPKVDLVGVDIRDIPRVLHDINTVWADPDSTNRR